MSRSRVVVRRDALYVLASTCVLIASPGVQAGPVDQDTAAPTEVVVTVTSTAPYLPSSLGPVVIDAPRSALPLSARWEPKQRSVPIGASQPTSSLAVVPPTALPIKPTKQSNAGDRQQQQRRQRQSTDDDPPTREKHEPFMQLNTNAP